MDPVHPHHRAQMWAMTWTVLNPWEILSMRSRCLVLKKCIGGMSYVERKIVAGVVHGVDLTEVYSPVRVAAVCAKYGLVPGTSFDLLTGYDFDLGFRSFHFGWCFSSQIQQSMLLPGSGCTEYCTSFHRPDLQQTREDLGHRWPSGQRQSTGLSSQAIHCSDSKCVPGVLPECKHLSAFGDDSTSMDS